MVMCFFTVTLAKLTKGLVSRIQKTINSRKSTKNYFYNCLYADNDKFLATLAWHLENWVRGLFLISPSP